MTPNWIKKTRMLHVKTSVRNKELKFQSALDHEFITTQTPYNMEQEDRARHDSVPNGLHLVIDVFNLLLNLLFFLAVGCNHPQSINFNLFP